MNIMKTLRYAGALAALPTLAFAQDAPTPTLNSGDMAFVAACCLLVMLMMLPGLGLFYAGMARSKNVLSVMTQVFAAAAMICVVWTFIGYSLYMTDGGAWQSVLGGFDKIFLAGVTQESLVGTIPEYLYIIFMMLFAAITPPIIIGSFAERMKFSAVMVFMFIWLMINYVPMAHMAWGGGWVFNMGVLDFAGGNVVHMNAGVAGLVAAIVLGPRRRGATTVPHNMTMTYTGGAMLWVGWLAFCGGCALTAGGFASLIMLNTLLGGAAGALSWMLVEWVHRKRPSTFGILSGAIAGLVAITPACGFVSPAGAIAVGLLVSPVCIFAVEVIKPKFGYDDSFDVFGVHGTGAIVGGILTVVFASTELGGTGYTQDRDFISMMLVQVSIIAFSGLVSLVTTYIALKVTSLLTGGLRVTEEEEYEGLDKSSHGESGYRMNDEMFGGSAL
ncbi:MAG: ammonium transporter [Proteobacteria bacterium]|nr:ammonium transporter [Pseudomonadota bacterium]